MQISGVREEEFPIWNLRDTAVTDGCLGGVDELNRPATASQPALPRQGLPHPVLSELETKVKSRLFLSDSY